MAVVTEGSFPSEFIIDDGFTDPGDRIRERRRFLLSSEIVHLAVMQTVGRRHAYDYGYYYYYD